MKIVEPMRITIQAKNAAKEAIEARQKLPPSRQFGLDKDEANRLGIASGVERAKQLLANRMLPPSDVIKTARFYARFRNCRTYNCEMSIKLWGGRAWCRACFFAAYGRSL